MNSFRYRIEKVIGMVWLSYRKVRRSLPSFSILVYHHIPQKDWSTFEEHIALFQREYGFVQPEHFQRAIAHGHLESIKGVVITFDDGFSSSFHAAQDILKRYSVRAFFFLPTGFLNAESEVQQKEYIAQRMFRGRLKAEDVPDEIRAMTWDEAGMLAKEGHVIGAHTVSHPMLSQVSDSGHLNDEIVVSGDEIEKRLGISVEWFAFPFGSIESIDSRSLHIVKKRYRFCCSSIRGRNRMDMDPYSILREPVSLDSPLSFVKCLVENGMGIYYRKKARRLQALSGQAIKDS